mmetsp:Transcript_5582/g.13138  ORF Transcript_5582/g.13138 Transcript_5582/m.13138 type:complete len:260 (-) Transcript_5582:743-1522(-)
MAPKVKRIPMTMPTLLRMTIRLVMLTSWTRSHIHVPFSAIPPCWPGPKHISNVDSYSASVEGSQGASPKGTLFVMINASPCKITLLNRMKISNRASVFVWHGSNGLTESACSPDQWSTTVSLQSRRFSATTAPGSRKPCRKLSLLAVSRVNCESAKTRMLMRVGPPPSPSRTRDRVSWDICPGTSVPPMRTRRLPVVSSCRIHGALTRAFWNWNPVGSWTTMSNAVPQTLGTKSKRRSLIAPARLSKPTRETVKLSSVP